MLFVITGNRRGLGAALTDELRRRGHRVVGCSSGAEPVAERVDVSDPEAVAAWARRVLAQEGVPDVLINNAAVVTPLAPMWEQTPDDMARILAVNVAGVHNVIRAFVPAMVARSQGTIVNISSGWGRTTSARVGPYCTSKFAVEGMTGSLAQGFPRGMTAVTLDPGTIDTDMLRSVFAAGASRYPKPEEWCVRAADLILSLDPSKNGSVLSVSHRVSGT